MSVRLFLVRPLPGVVAESQRQSHAVPAPAGAAVPDRLRAYCGAIFTRAEVELLDRPTGMPCVACLQRVPFPSGELSTRGSDEDQARQSADIGGRLDAIDRLLRRIIARVDEITRDGPTGRNPENGDKGER